MLGPEQGEVGGDASRFSDMLKLQCPCLKKQDYRQVGEMAEK